jgi:phosphoglycolate phosphatase-like HAD superfamily hydrolase
MKPAVIFDLDQTLLDTSSIAHLRSPGNWNKAVAQVPTLSPFAGIDAIFDCLAKNNIEIVIITTSPGMYCTAIVNHFQWKIAGQVCYHDVNRRKPDPEAFIKAVRAFDLDISRTISAGDRDIDVFASNAVHIPSIACPWASPDAPALLAAKPTFIAQDTTALLGTIKAFFQIR